MKDEKVKKGFLRPFLFGKRMHSKEKEVSSREQPARVGPDAQVSQRTEQDDGLKIKGPRGDLAVRGVIAPQRSDTIAHKQDLDGRFEDTMPDESSTQIILDDFMAGAKPPGELVGVPVSLGRADVDFGNPAAESRDQILASAGPPVPHNVGPPQAVEASIERATPHTYDSGTAAEADAVPALPSPIHAGSESRSPLYDADISEPTSPVSSASSSSESEDSSHFSEEDKIDAISPAPTPFLVKTFEDLPFGPDVPAVRISFLGRNAFLHRADVI